MSRGKTNYIGEIVEYNPSEEINARSHRKERHYYGGYTVVLVHKGEIKTPIDLRFYGTGSTNYACLWFNAANMYASGSGSAGGYGYDRESAAVYEAFAAAGVKFKTHWAGMGDTATEEALYKLAKKLYPRCKNIKLVKNHA